MKESKTERLLAESGKEFVRQVQEKGRERRRERKHRN